MPTTEAPRRARCRQATPYPQPWSRIRWPTTSSGRSAFGRSSQRRVNSTYQSATESYRAGDVVMTKAKHKPAWLGTHLCLAIPLSACRTCPRSPAWWDSY
jgi:hypothetical protein